MPTPQRASPESVRLKEHVEALIAGVYRAIDALREAIDIRVSAIEKANETAARVLEKAVDVANRAMEFRLSGMNEFRSAIDDLVKTFVSKSEFLVTRDQMEKDIKDIRERISFFVSRSDFAEYKSRVEKEIEVLKLSKANLEGKASQTSVTTALVISVFGMIIGLVGIVISLSGM